MEPIDISKTVPTFMANHRDAIHIAIVAVTSESALRHGEPVALSGNGRNVVAPVPMGQHIGIITPFIGHVVPPGQLTWMMLIPGSITSLRHDWTHPAFEEAQATLSGQEVSAYANAHRWLQQFAAEVGVPLDAILEHAEDWITCQAYWCEGGRFEGCGVPDAFWNHYETFTGKRAPEEKRSSFFSCSC